MTSPDQADQSDPFQWMRELYAIDEDNATPEEQALLDYVLPESEMDEFDSVSARLCFWIDGVVREKAAEHFGGEPALSALEAKLGTLTVAEQFDVIAGLPSSQKAAVFEIGLRLLKPEIDAAGK